MDLKPKKPLEEILKDLNVKVIDQNRIKEMLEQYKPQQIHAELSFSLLNSIKFPSKDNTITRETLLKNFPLEGIKRMITPLVDNVENTKIAVIINKLLSLSIWSVEDLAAEDRQMILEHFTIPEENQAEVIEAKINELNDFIKILTQVGRAIIENQAKAETSMPELINFAQSDLYYKLYSLGIRAELLLASYASDCLSADELNQLHLRISPPEGEMPTNTRIGALYNFIKKAAEGNLDELLDTPKARQYAFDMALKLGLDKILDRLLTNDLYLRELFLNQKASFPSILYNFMRGDPDSCNKFLAPQIWHQFMQEQKILLVKVIALRSGTETRTELLEKIQETIDVDFYINVIANESESQKAALTEVFLPELKKNIISNLGNQKFSYELKANILKDIIQKLPLEVIETLVAELNSENLISLAICKTIIRTLEYEQTAAPATYTKKIALLKKLIPELTNKMNKILDKPEDANFEQIIGAIEGLKLLQQEKVANYRTKKTPTAVDEKYINENLRVLYEKAIQYQKDSDTIPSTLEQATEIVTRYNKQMAGAEAEAKTKAEAEAKAKAMEADLLAAENTSPPTKNAKKKVKLAKSTKAEAIKTDEKETKKGSEDIIATEEQARQETEAAKKSAENIRKKQEYDLAINEEGWLQPGRKPTVNKMASTTNHDHKPNGGGSKISSKAASSGAPSGKFDKPDNGKVQLKPESKSVEAKVISTKPNDGGDRAHIKAALNYKAALSGNVSFKSDKSDNDAKSVAIVSAKIASLNSQELVHKDETKNQEVFIAEVEAKTDPIIPELKFGNFDEDSQKTDQQAKIEQLQKEKQALEEKLKLLESQVAKAESVSDTSVGSRVEERLADLERAFFAKDNNADYTPPPSSLSDGLTVFYPQISCNAYGQQYYMISFPDAQGYHCSAPLLQDLYGYNFQDGLGVVHRLYPYNPNPVNQTSFFGPSLPPGGGGGRSRKAPHKKQGKAPSNSKLSDESFDNKLVVLLEEKFKDFDFTLSNKLKYPEPINYEQAEYDVAKQEAENRKDEKVSWIPDVVKETLEQLPDFKIYIPAHLMFGVLLAANKLPGGFGVHNHFPELDV